ncbi:MAG TPA: ABC transporter permease [Thermomicrobiales bacterium]|nr:ABC transporter permease [Thermomicrobiales bacterium]
MADTQATTATPADAIAAAHGRRHDTMTRLIIRRFLRHRLAVAGLVVLALLVLSALLAPVIAPYDPDALSTTERLQGPSSRHWLGTDDVGRDIFSRVLYGGRISLLIGVAATAVSLLIGTVVGAIAGYFGGFVDNLLMRVVDVFLSFPSLFILIVLATVIRTNSVLRQYSGSIWPIAIVIGGLSWMALARLIRATFLSLREKEFVEAARAAGASNSRIMIRHILPGSLGPIIVQGTLLIAATIITESGLSYLGFGVQPPTATWGTLLDNAQGKMQELPLFAIAPGLMIFLTVMSINYVGDGLRDAFDPHSTR